MNQIDNIIAIAEEYRTAESAMFRHALRAAIEQALGQWRVVGYRQLLPDGGYAYCITPQFFDNPEPVYIAQPADHLRDATKMVKRE